MCLTGSFFLGKDKKEFLFQAVLPFQHCYVTDDPGGEWIWRPKSAYKLSLGGHVSLEAQFPQCKMSCCSVAKSCPTLCGPIDCSTSGSSPLHYLPEFAQTHVHWINDAIQPSPLLLPPSPHALDFSQHQGFFPVCQLFASVSLSIGASASASVLSMNIQSWFSLELTGLIKWVQW